GDDFFHQGAFRQSYGFEYATDLELSKDESVPLPIDRYDTYDFFLDHTHLSGGGGGDQENFYGAIKTYATLEPLDSAGRNSVVLGPWNHGSWSRGKGDKLGNISFGSNTKIGRASCRE